MSNKELPPLPKHLMIFDQSDDSCFGSLVEHAWDSDYATMKVGDPMFTADQMRDYARAALATQPEPAAQDKEDAERYRWLDKNHVDLHVKSGGKFGLPDYAQVSFGWRRRTWRDGKPQVSTPTLSDAIDAARAATNPQGGA